MNRDDGEIQSAFKMINSRFSNYRNYDDSGIQEAFKRIIQNRRSGVNIQRPNYP